MVGLYRVVTVDDSRGTSRIHDPSVPIDDGGGLLVAEEARFGDGRVDRDDRHFAARLHPRRHVVRVTRLNESPAGPRSVIGQEAEFLVVAEVDLDLIAICFISPWRLRGVNLHVPTRDDHDV